MRGLYKVRKERVARALLTLAFIAAFVPYLFGLTLGVQLAAAIIPIFVGLILLPIIYPDRLNTAFRRLSRPKYALLALALPLPASMVAAISGQWNSVGYALLIAMVLTACQMILGFMPLSQILKAFSQASVVIIPIFFLSYPTQIVQSAFSASRLLFAEGLHPNTVGFVFASFVAIFVWRAADSTSSQIVRSVYIVLAMAAAFAIFLASSRASMLALVCAAVWLAGMWSVRSIRRRRLFLKPIFVIVAALVVLGTVVFIAIGSSYLERDVIGYTASFLQLDSSYRGFGTGFTGRIPQWGTTLSAISQNGVWVSGLGYGTSEDKLGFSIDNGYLTVMYEYGVFMLIMVTGQFLWCLWICWRRYFRAVDLVESRYLLIISGLVIIILVNNIFASYLFGLGNPFSLLGLFLLLLDRDAFVTSRRRSVGSMTRTMGSYTRFESA